MSSRHFVRGLALLSTTPLLMAQAHLLAERSVSASLGKPVEVQSTLAAFPLSGFHRTSRPFTVGGRPALLFLGTNLAQVGSGVNAVDGYSAAERWPAVKALAQFGRFTGLRAAKQVCYPSPAIGKNVCTTPTFDWAHAGYSSKYLAFDHKDLLTASGKRFQPMTGKERAFYYKYSRNTKTRFAASAHTHIATSPFYRDAPDDILSTVVEAAYPVTDSSTRRLPLIAMGRYVETVPQVSSPGDFGVTVYANAPDPNTHLLASDSSHLSFSDAQNALIRGREPDRASSLVVDVNAEANIITALICQADGGKPAKVCNRAVIRSISRHVR
jgi:hypothetical protein